MKCWIAAAAVLFASGVIASQEALSPELQGLVDTERAFARTATLKGLRDSFLDYFADDSIALVPAPESATKRLRAQPSQPFSALEITWEPRLGDLAASNDIGWLTGPSTIVDHTAAQPTPRFGNYLSIWRRQPDGRWRVYIDVGVNVPELPEFGPGFTRLPVAARYAGADSKDAATRILREADQSLNDRIATAGFGAALGDRAVAVSRLHRPGVTPIVGPAAIRAWAATNATAMSAVSSEAEAAQSGDLGYSYGTYAVTAPAAQHGAYVRTWTRDAGGAWFVAADVAQPAR